MSQQPKSTRRNQKPKRKHIPALDANALEIALQQLEATHASTAGKRMIEQSLRAAANPDAERIDVVIAGLPEGRRESIEAAAKGIGKQQRGIAKRARAGLSDISDTEWERLVNEANADSNG